MPKDKIYQCVYEKWYRFRTCEVKTCKNHTTRTESGCLAIDRTIPDGNKMISDSELHYYKFTGTKVSTRIIALKRKKAIQRIKNLITLYKFVEYINSSCRPTIEFRGVFLQNKLRKYPFSVKKLEFRNWMLEYVVDDIVFQKFLKRYDGECSAYRLHSVLGMTEIKFVKFREEVERQLRLSGVDVDDTII